MLRLKPRQREVIADKVPDVVNIITAAIVIGFMVGEPRFSPPAFVAAITFWGVSLLCVLMIVEPK